MNKEKALQIIFWLTLFTSFLICKVSASGANNGNQMDDETQLEDFPDIGQLGQTGQVNDNVLNDLTTQDPVLNADNFVEPAEQHTQDDPFLDDEENEVGPVNHNTDPEVIYCQIIAGELDILPANVLTNLSAESLGFLLNNHTGARLVGINYSELLPTLINYVVIESFDIEFFRHLNVFNDDNYFQIESIPFTFINYAVQTQSLFKNLNLNGLITKFESFDSEVALTLDPIFILPHLFDFPNLHNPSYFMIRGISFNPNSSGSKRDFIIWNISLQLFIYNLINNVDYANSENYQEICAIVLGELKAGHQAGFPDFQLNYFGIDEHQIFTNELVFNSHESTKLADKDIRINYLSESVGLSPDFMSINYADLTSDLKIIYRLLMFVAIFNPTIVDGDISERVITMVSTSKYKDSTETEIELLFEAFWKSGRADIIAKIYNRVPNSMFKKIAEPKLTRSQEDFNSFLRKLNSLVDVLPFIRVSHSSPFDTQIDMVDENYFRNAQSERAGALISGWCASSSTSCTNVDTDTNYYMDLVDLVPDPKRGSKRKANDENVIEKSIFQSHFLTENQLRRLSAESVLSNQLSRTFTVPYPDANIFNERMDHLQQSLNLPDFGEEAWDAHIEAIQDPLKKQQYITTEQHITGLVLETFKCLHFKYKNPNTEIEIVFADNGGYGDGVTGEAIEIFSRAIILPQFKVFFYNTKILGFVPYPLLHPEIMGVLGYVNAWFIKKADPLNWYLPNDYIDFLFYEENPTVPMQELIETLYPGIFYNIDHLVNDISNPLDFFPTTFRTHQPFPFEMGKPAEPFDLFNPASCIDPNFFTMSMCLDESKNQILDEIIDVHQTRRRKFEETKDEYVYIETKEDFATIDSDDAASIEDILLTERLEEQRWIKKQITDAIRHSLSLEVIEHLLLGRFSFMRQFLRSFNEFSRAHVTADFYKQIQLAQQTELNANDIISGLYFSAEMANCSIEDEENDQNLTPKEALETILRSYSSKMLRTFYWFCTGCSNLPLTGLASKPIKIVVDRSTLLPSAATCFRTFRFHTRPTLAANFDSMHTALTESSGYQYIEGREQVETRIVVNTNTENEIEIEDESEHSESEIEDESERSESEIEYENELSESESDQSESDQSDNDDD